MAQKGNLKNLHNNVRLCKRAIWGRTSVRNDEVVSQSSHIVCAGGGPEAWEFNGRRTRHLVITIELPFHTLTALLIPYVAALSMFTLN